MGFRLLVELLHVTAGLAAAAAMAAAAAWAYPLGREVIWWCGGTAMVATVVLAIGPLRRARLDDRARVARGADRARVR